MILAAIKTQEDAEITEVARRLGKLGGRPQGAYSSPLARWLRGHVRQKQREGWSRREGFYILAETENRIGKDMFRLTDETADELGIETIDANGNDRPACVSWAYWKKIWLEVANGNRFP